MQADKQRHAQRPAARRINGLMGRRTNESTDSQTEADPNRQRTTTPSLRRDKELDRYVNQC